MSKPLQLEPEDLERLEFTAPLVSEQFQIDGKPTFYPFNESFALDTEWPPAITVFGMEFRLEESNIRNFSAIGRQTSAWYVPVR